MDKDRNDCAFCPICAVVRAHMRLKARAAKWNWWDSGGIMEIALNLVIIVPILCLAGYGAYELIW